MYQAKEIEDIDKSHHNSLEGFYLLIHWLFLPNAISLLQ